MMGMDDGAEKSGGMWSLTLADFTIQSLKVNHIICTSAIGTNVKYYKSE